MIFIVTVTIISFSFISFIKQAKEALGDAGSDMYEIPNFSIMNSRFLFNHFLLSLDLFLPKDYWYHWYIFCGILNSNIHKVFHSSFQRDLFFGNWNSFFKNLIYLSPPYFEQLILFLSSWQKQKFHSSNNFLIWIYVLFLNKLSMFSSQFFFSFSVY